jgi:hypothetical protein
VYAQQPIPKPDNVNRDTTLRLPPLKSDTVTKKINQRGSLDSKVIYSAEDSIITDRDNNIVKMYGKARVKYEDMELDADYIQYDQKNNTLFAKGLINSKTKRYGGRPLFNPLQQTHYFLIIKPEKVNLLVFLQMLKEDIFRPSNLKRMSGVKVILPEVFIAAVTCHILMSTLVFT